MTENQQKNHKATGVTVVMPDDLKNCVDRLAKESDRSRAQQIRFLLRESLDRLSATPIA